MTLGGNERLDAVRTRTPSSLAPTLSPGQIQEGDYACGTVRARHLVICGFNHESEEDRVQALDHAISLLTCLFCTEEDREQILPDVRRSCGEVMFEIFRYHSQMSSGSRQNDWVGNSSRLVPRRVIIQGQV